MTTEVRNVLDGPGSVAQVWSVLTSPQWPQRRARELGDDSRLIERVERPDGSLLLAVSRALPEGTPGPLQRFLPADGRVLQIETWEPEQGGVRTGSWRVEIDGAPARMGGTMRLEPLPTGSRYTIEGTVKVAVPIIGRKAESFIAAMVHLLAERESRILLKEVVS